MPPRVLTTQAHRFSLPSPVRRTRLMRRGASGTTAEDRVGGTLEEEKV
ncbi:MULTISPECIES: hypothetical protein [Streptomyces]|nr:MULTISPECIES: hypothetical protein [Streptomyces]